jgi:putative PIN family toxin of toxin-antitoxin system
MSLLMVVPDTNIFVSGTIISYGIAYEILKSWRHQEFILVTSEAIIAEIQRVLRYPRIRDKYSVTEEDIRRLMISLYRDAIVTAGNYEVRGVPSDPDDDKFLACALESQADYIVTGDPDLLSLKYYHGVNILNPRDFLEKMTLSQTITE